MLARAALLLLALLTSFGVAPPGPPVDPVGGGADGPSSGYPSLDLTQVDGPSGAQRFCRGTSQRITLRANARATNWPARPVAGASVTLAGGGIPQTAISNGAGLVQFTVQNDRAGQITLLAGAAKAGYDVGAAARISYGVDDCHWSLALDYREEYAISAQSLLVVGATVHWAGTIDVEDSGTTGPDRALRISAGAGEWSAYGSNNLDAPVKVVLTPDMRGSYLMAWSGRMHAGEMLLNLDGVVAEGIKTKPSIEFTDTFGQVLAPLTIKAPWMATDGNVWRTSQGSTPVAVRTTGTWRFVATSGPPSFFVADRATNWRLSLRLDAVRPTP